MLGGDNPSNLAVSSHKGIEVSPRTIGLIDGSLFLLSWSAFGFLSASHWWGALPIIVFILVPSAALVSWRGASLSKQGRANFPSLLAHVKDGGKWGGIAGFVLFAWSFTSEVIAAGGPLLGTPFFSLATAEYALILSSVFCIGGTLFGAAHGLAFYFINRWLMRDC